MDGFQGLALGGDPRGRAPWWGPGAKPWPCRAAARIWAPEPIGIGLMISLMRRYLETWVARAFFMLMVVAFVIWGVGDVVRLVGTDTWVAKVGDQTIEVPEVQQAFQRQMADLSRRLPPSTDVTAEMRRAVASAAVEGLIGQAAVAQEE